MYEKMLEEHTEFLRNLSEKDLVESLRIYTTHEYKIINKEIREGGALSSRTEKIVNDIDSIFEMIYPIKEPLTLYRGVTIKDIKYDKTFISTTYNEKIAKDFSTRSSCCIIIFSIPVGSKVIFLESISDSPDEQEVLLDRNANFVITAIKEAKSLGEKDTIYITYIPPKAIETKELEPVLEKAFDQLEIIRRIVDIFPEDEFELFEDDEEALRSSINDLFQKTTESKNNISQSMSDTILKRLKEKF
jgi:hypothetical protein